MTDYRWGAEGPPPEAYSRVTNPERFEPIIPAILSIIDQLETTYDVDRNEGYGLDDELESRSSTDITRPTIRLTPRNRRAAPITVAFSSFPGLHVRFGKWRTDAYPGCGCDACDETPDHEIDRLTDVIHNVTRGRFRETRGEPRIPRLADKRWPQGGWVAYAPLSELERAANYSRRANIDGIRNWWPFRKKVQHLNWQPWPLRR